MLIRSFSPLISLGSLFAIAGSLFAAPPVYSPENKANGLSAELLAESPGLLLNAAAEQSLWTGKVQAEVEHILAAARKLKVTNPAQAEQDLKLVLEHLQAVPIDFQIRN